MTDVVRIFAPMIVWLALFSGVYGLHGIGCGLGWPELELGPLTLHRAALLAAWALALAVQSLLLLALAGPWRSGQGFVRGISLGLAAAAVAAVAWSLFPVVFATSCT